MSEEVKCTVDGVPVKRGDVVWRWRGWGSVRQRKLDKIDLGMWWDGITKGSIYSTERAALEAALSDERKNIAKARQRIRTAERNAARLKTRLAEVKRC